MCTVSNVLRETNDVSRTAKIAHDGHCTELSIQVPCPAFIMRSYEALESTSVIVMYAVSIG